MDTIQTSDLTAHDAGTSSALTRAGPDGHEAGDVAFLVVVSIYALGLAIWLVLGVLPTIADTLAPVRHWAESVAGSSSVFAGPARRLLDANQSMPGMEMEATKVSSVVWQYCFSALNFTLGAILVIRRPRGLVPRLLALALLGTAATFNKPSHAVFHILGEPWPIKTLHFSFHIVSGVAYLWAVLLFPDGHLPRRFRLEGGRLAVVVVAVTAAVTVVSWRSSFVDHPIFFVIFFGVAVSLLGLGAQTVRIVDPEATPMQRRSSRLLAAALLPAFATGLAWLAGRAGVAIGGSIGMRAEHFDAALQGVFPAVFAVVPVVLFAGILRYRLWNLDWLLSRALVYGLLGVIVAAVYVATVALSDVVAGHNLWSSVVVLSVVAVTIDPLRRAMRRWNNRVVYGQVLNPTDAVRAMLAGLDSLEPGDELQQLTQVVVAATRARTCEVWLGSPGEDSRVARFPPSSAGGATEGGETSAAETARGTASPGSEVFEAGVTYKGSLLGTLKAKLPPGVGLTPAETALLDSLASHAGLVIHNSQLNIDLSRHVAVLADQLELLKASRRRLVAAQDAERRKLERDLHDGAQQSLVALRIGLRSVARPGLDTEQRRSEAAELIRLLEGATDMLDELTSDQGPRILAEAGLVDALAAAGELAARAGMRVDVHGSIERTLPRDALAAIYFCCLEALQNATKYAHASRVQLRIDDDGWVIGFEVQDDGRGFDPSQVRPGSGLTNLAQRLTVIGGDIVVESAPGAGTCVRGWLPVGAFVEQA